MTDRTKSDIVREFAEQNNIPVIELKASEFDPSDYMGIPAIQGKLNQHRIDEIEAQGGFDEEEA